MQFSYVFFFFSSFSNYAILILSFVRIFIFHICFNKCIWHSSRCFVFIFNIFFFAVKSQLCANNAQTQNRRECAREYNEWVKNLQININGKSRSQLTHQNAKRRRKKYVEINFDEHEKQNRREKKKIMQCKIGSN